MCGTTTIGMKWTRAGRAAKAMFFIVALGWAFATVAAEPTISVSAKQRYPWNGLVDLSFTLTGTGGVLHDTSFTARDVAGGTNITMATVRKTDGTAANVAQERLMPGAYSWVWDAAADLPKDFKCDRVTVTGSAAVSSFSYSVKFNANGGSGTMSNEAFTYGTAKALTANAYSKSGYNFFGWSKNTTAIRTYTDKQVVSNLTATPNATVNLYAIWTINSLADGLNCTALPWRTDDSHPWYKWTKESKDGVASVISGSQKSGVYDSWMETTIFGPATISFYYAKTLYGSSKFTITRDSTVIFTDSTPTIDSAWMHKSFSIPSGAHVIRFNYYHSGTDYSGGNVGVRIDQFQVAYN